jgi:hypothetical protein
MLGNRRTHALAPVLLLLLSPGLLGVAQAYIDPGTGSYMLQLVIGGILGALFALGLFWKRTRAWVSRLFARRKNDADHRN